MQLEVANLERYAFCDPASGKGQLKKVRARQAIVVIGVDYLLRVFVLHAWCGKLPTSKFRDEIISTYDRFQPRRMGIEANAMQALFGDLVYEKAVEELGHARISPINSPTKIEKDFKIRAAIEPILNDNRLFVSATHVELLSELRGFPSGQLKDLVDALAMAIMLIPRRTPERVNTGEVDALAKYLRDTGAPAWYIERAVAEAKAGIRTLH